MIMGRRRLVSITIRFVRFCLGVFDLHYGLDSGFQRSFTISLVRGSIQWLDIVDG
jgi:hypothetical protein